VAVGFFLQSLLESLACPFAAFGLHFHLNFPQGPRARLFRVHPFPFVEVLVVSDEELFTPQSHPNYGGSVKMRPCFTKAGRGVKVDVDGNWF
jgi:hypothetical protein